MENLDKVTSILKKQGITVCVVTSHENIAYLTGYDVPLPIGSGVDFALGFPQTFAVLDIAEKKIKMVIQSGLVKHVKKDPAIDFFTYDIFDHFKAFNIYTNFYNAVDGALKNCSAYKDMLVGVEMNTIPKILVDRILYVWTTAVFKDVYADLFESRKVKSTAEIELLRESAVAADAAQQILNEISESYGMNEFEVWAKCVDAASRICGAPAVVSGELETGKRCNVVNYPGGPIDKIIEKGDMGIMDFSVRLNGYWCDCCNTVVFGTKPTKYQQHFADTTKAGFEAAVRTIKPGVKCSDVYKAAEKAYERYGEKVPHYIGHQIGCTVNEDPRIVPYDDTLIEENMAFSLEPGCYEGEAGDSGSRNEKMVYVTASGCEIFNQFKWGM
ncbi:MAG: Xaa-Pro peptidase family protein [Treponema sp.]|jgi:Xaa-Pro dipeptidase|nr:Xaa-Pro peptidase family protein [Treponema sp.]